MRLLTTFLLVSTLLLLASGEAIGCKCSIQAREFNSAVKINSLIFLGKLVQVSQVNDSSTSFSATYRFVPLKTWRGQPADTLTLHTGSSCGIRLVAGSTYVLYTNSGQDLHICQRIVSRNTQAEIKKLDSYFVKPRPLPKRP
ncbi:hypothetical protein FY528_07485 [Hymenobacter lutimineralis]|uniref:NTR domain-containing protein n=1 Tax=Hymenobacter lutimineralis TaxID=2606448 RepID=A0A5D6V6U9_9BACT|nr:hypothetical protein [Hymenobacter lutimineralis]TYZ10892.1 hypothetical protein FY528_07485 [Hymenobacter lutimineralis]